ncbi:protein kinase [Myxococcota bacterium]|nr:protein kinase [Myxococcota bacterium]MBU1535119.1 protein kinase [Myxococcota bacterium]
MPRLSKGLQIGKSFKIFAFEKNTQWGERYRAVHLPSNRLATVHLLNTLSDLSPKGAARVVSVANDMKGVIHKNIVESFGGGYLDPEKKAPYVAEAYVDGETIREYISRKYPLGAPITSSRLILFHLGKLLEDIEGTFHHGAIHASNITISDVGRVFVSEFGLLEAAHAHIPLESLLPAAELPFLAPEIKTTRTGSITADLFSLGILANYLLSGKLPIEEGVPQLKPEIHKLVVEAITAAIAPDPADRPATVAEFNWPIEENLKERKRSSNAVIMVDLLETFQEDDEEEKKFMVQKGRLDYGPYSAREIREKAIDEVIAPDHIIVNIDSGFRKKLESHPDFIDFMSEFIRRMELKRREEAEAVVEIKEKQQSRTFKLAIALGIVGVIALAATIMLYKTVVDTGKSRRKNNLVSENDELEVATMGKSQKATMKKHRRRRSRRRSRSMGSSGSNGGSGGSGEEIKVYALDNLQLTRTQINSIVDGSIISQIARSCIPSKGRIYIGYQINGRRGRVAYASAKLDGKSNKKISRCAYGILKRLQFPKLNTDISGFGGISF